MLWVMKNILGLGSLVFVIVIMIGDPAYSGDEKTCAKSAANANTEWAQNMLYWSCVRDNNTFFKTKEHSCAINAAGAKTKSAAVRLYWACVRD